MDNMTQWFPGNVKPVRIGVYQIDVSDRDAPFRRPRWSVWDGKKWLLCTHDFPYALVMTQPENHQRFSWRGLADKPPNA